MSEFSSRQDLLAGLKPTSYGSFLLQGDPNRPTFIFVHGFATFMALQGYAGGLELKARLLAMESALPGREPAQARLF